MDRDLIRISMRNGFRVLIKYHSPFLWECDRPIVMENSAKSKQIRPHHCHSGFLFVVIFICLTIFLRQTFFLLSHRYGWTLQRIRRPRSKSWSEYSFPGNGFPVRISPGSGAKGTAIRRQPFRVYQQGRECCSATDVAVRSPVGHHNKFGDGRPNGTNFPFLLVTFLFIMPPQRFLLLRATLS